MIKATCYRENHGRRDRVEFIGGPWDGADIHVDTPIDNTYLRLKYAGEYCYADTVEWCYVWVPVAEPSS